MNICKITAVVIIDALSQLLLLQQAPDTDFHIGGLCDMKTANLSAVILHCKCYMWIHHLVMHLVLPDMTMLHMMVSTASFEWNWFYLIISLYNPPSLTPSIHLNLFF